MQITIQRLTLTAFKGVKNLSLDLDGKSAYIRGRNGTGKTTLFDAFTWLLFGKDSKDSSKFDYKPLDKDGQPRTGTDTTVEAVLNVDGKIVTLRRTMHEKWQQKPGNLDPIYQGDETLCWIDDVPVKLEKDYKPYIASLIGDEEQFKVLSIHGYFMRKHWQQRRAMLMAAAGDDPEARIMLRPEFSGLAEVLQGKAPEDARKRLMDQKKRVSTELDAIPARLDELQRALDPVTDEQIAEADRAIKEANQQIDLINSQLSGTEESFAHARSLMAKEREIAAKLDTRKRALDKPNNDWLDGIQAKIEEARAGKASLEREAMRLEDDIAMVDRDIKALKYRRERLLVQWDERNDQTFTPGPVTTICKLCGQPLPADQISAAKQREYTTWAEKKDEDLSLIEEQGKNTADRIVRCEDERANLHESLLRKRDAIASAETVIKQLQEEANQPLKAPDYQADAEYVQLLHDLETVRAEIAAPSDNETQRQQLTQQRAEISARISELGKVAWRKEQYESNQGRIRELEEQRKKLGQDAIRIDGQLSMLADFIHACCDAMEENINAMFTTIRWHLTDYRKDGTHVDCCVPYVGGVSYDSTLNNGAMINAGIEAIRVLSRASGISVPCFVDNAEAVNQLAYLPGQMIRLSVSDDPELIMTLED